MLKITNYGHTALQMQDSKEHYRIHYNEKIKSFMRSETMLSDRNSEMYDVESSILDEATIKRMFGQKRKQLIHAVLTKGNLTARKILQLLNGE